MDGSGSLNVRNWGFYEPAIARKGHLGLQLMSTETEKSLLGGHNHHYHPHHPSIMASMNGGAYYHHRVGGISESPVAMNYTRDVWINHRDKYLNMLPGNHNHPDNAVLVDTSVANPVQIVQTPNLPKNETISQLEESGVERDISPPLKKRSGGKAQKSPKTKKAKKAPGAPRGQCSPSTQRARTPKKCAEVVINGIDMDISGIALPVCSCTGTPQQCYRWGSGGWQSACCTTGMSMYPLPMSTKRRGSRITGRKMSLGAFKKVLEKLTSEGYNFTHPIDLKTYWAKHGTNKFVTIR
ncbi:unnamed protein product [Ilex paraguariensis]|uniref:GAGA-binding transcriptional activator n=1 Tax=Ilex paraguariensis TaxID=185542 RepID=A0ABC8TBH3_9AQUA